MLEIRSLSVSYGSRAVLKNISFDLPAGSILAVIGPNGAGKTTLIRALTGIVPMNTGQVQVHGRSLNQLSAGERARWIAVVPQARNLPPAFTAWETVLLGRTPHLNWLGQVSAQDEAIARQAMQRTQSLELANRPVGELSGGEQQRLLLARALAQAAPILLLDEPTSHLDLQFQLSLLDQVKSLAVHDQLAVMIVLHDLNLVARYADRAALLVQGELRAIGPTRDVLTPELLSPVYHVPLEVHHAGPNHLPYLIPS
jgi:ABC-type cobalamin/Fe3+-siderophores transport system ATPase subunit